MQIELSKDEIMTLKSVLNDRIYILERLSNYKKLTLNQKSRLNEMKNILNKLNKTNEV